MIKISDVSFSYGNEKILSSLSAEFKENKTYCVMGRSGVGKTTFLNLLSGLIKPDCGRITFSEDMKKSFIFQEDRLIPWLSVYDNIKYVIQNEKIIKQSLCETNLWDSRNKLPDELSGGMKRRCAIARANAFAGDIFFIDEPLYGLDAKTSEEILKLIKKSIKEKTSFIVTHSPEEAFFLADKIIFIENLPITHLNITDKSNFSSSEDIKEFVLR